MCVQPHGRIQCVTATNSAYFSSGFRVGAGAPEKVDSHGSGVCSVDEPSETDAEPANKSADVCAARGRAREYTFVAQLHPETFACTCFAER